MRGARVTLLVMAALGFVVTPASALEGGRVARTSEVPFAAFITKTDGNCTGEVIAPKVVLTAGHCFRGLTAADVEVVTGAADTTADASFQQPVASIQTDPDFGRIDEFAHDVALVHLRYPVHVKEARLPSPADEHVIARGRTITFAGWGDLGPGRATNLPNKIRIGKVRIARGTDLRGERA